MRSFDEVDRLTIPEYSLLMESVRLRIVDHDYRNHLQAFLSYAVQAQKGSDRHPRLAYRTFRQFYDYEKALKDAERPERQDNRMKELSKLIHGKE